MFFDLVDLEDLLKSCLGKWSVADCDPQSLGIGCDGPVAVASVPNVSSATDCFGCARRDGSRVSEPDPDSRVGEVGP